jgi:hypothetical protein
MSVRRALLCAAAIAAFGCDAATPMTVVGTYKGESLGSASQAEPIGNLERGLAASVTLHVNADNTFRMIAAVLPVEGKWALEGRTLTLTPNQVLGFGSSGIGEMKFNVTGGKLEPLDQNPRFRFVKEPAEPALP